ncbi:MAG: hypothetical protein R3B08_02005 [Nitrospira sp.]
MSAPKRWRQLPALQPVYAFRLGWFSNPLIVVGIVVEVTLC